ncbi:hypothetical protein AALB12_27405, partial [Blautia coccoides]|uniref:hypothetical protein n=1 Tax=Blautia producta TaxID=33035 RepID=UPI00351185BC
PRKRRNGKQPRNHSRENKLPGTAQALRYQIPMEVHPPDIQKVKHIQAMKTPGLVDLNPIVAEAVSLPVKALQ